MTGISGVRVRGYRCGGLVVWRQGFGGLWVEGRCARYKWLEECVVEVGLRWVSGYLLSGMGSFV